MKTTSSAFASHIAQTVTTLATCWKVIRTDGTTFHFTDHNHNITVSSNVYKAATGYSRSPIANDVSMAVDNLDIEAIFDSSAITEGDLIAGLYDFAEVQVFAVNWNDTSQGIIKLRRGWMGEVVPQPTGIFRSELRGLTQAFSRRIGEVYGPECRADLGDSRCNVPINPDKLQRFTSYAAGDYVRVASAAGAYVGASLLAHFDSDASDTSGFGASGTLRGQASINSSIFKFGSGALELSPSGSVNPSSAYVSFPDASAYTIGTSPFTFEAWVRFKQLTTTNQIIASHYDNVSNQKGWVLRRNGAALEFVGYRNGISAGVTLTASATWATGTWYHTAVTRNSANNLRLWVDGAKVGSATYSSTIFNSNSPLRIGKWRSTTGDDQPLYGFVDDARLVIGTALYASAFTAPVSAFSDIGEYYASAPTVAFNDRIFQVTTAGKTQIGTQPAYNYGIGSTTTDGTAVFTSIESWMKAATVSTVTDRGTFNLVVSDSRAVTGWFDGGVVRFDTGLNTKIAREIKRFVASGGLTKTFLAFPFAVAAGDTLSIYPGCDKTLATCRDRFDNVVNFRGEPFVPGQDAVLKIPDAR